jgi:hypothetical protein
MLEGISQGCPLSPLFAFIVVACLLEPIDKLLRERTAAQHASGDPGNDGYSGISHLLSYVDSISTCVYLPGLAFLCNTLKTHSTSLGCFVNTSKTRMLPSCNGTSPLAPSQMTTRHLASPSHKPLLPFPTPQTPSTQPVLLSQSNSLPGSASLVTRLAWHPLPRTFSQHASPLSTGALPPSPIQSPTTKQDSASSPNA